MTSHRYGEITGRYVIYRGDSVEVEGVQYLNVEEYLNKTGVGEKEGQPVTEEVEEEYIFS